MRDTGVFGGSVGPFSGFVPSTVRRPRRIVLLLLVLSVSLSACMAASAGAATPERFFKETFGSAAQPTFGTAQGLGAQGMAIDESDGDLLVIDRATSTIRRFKADGTPDNFSALGTNVISEANGHPLVFGGPKESQIAVDNSGTATDGNIYVTDYFGGQGAHAIDIFAKTGQYLGSLTEANGIHLKEACGVAVDPSGAVYVGDFNGGVDKFVPTGATPTNADFDPGFTTSPSLNGTCTLAAGAGPSDGALFAANFQGGPVVKLDAATGTTEYAITPPVLQTVTVSVISSSGNVLLAEENGSVFEYDASGATEATEASRFTTGTSTVRGVAGLQGQVYASKFGADTLDVFGNVFPSPELEPTEPLGADEVRLHGVVHLEEVPLSACKFEYGPISAPGFEAEIPCEPPAGSIPADSAPHQVAATLSGLLQHETYRVRLTTTNADVTLRTPVGTFTAGAPEISEVRARDAGQSSAILEAKVDPNGVDTSYRFEWGPTAAYGTSVPAQAVSIGAGNSPVLVNAELSGLTAATTYHYRVVATSSRGVTESTDQELETVDTCGLPDRRCFELVSPREPGPISRPGASSDEELGFQSATSSGSLMYSVANGLPGTTKGAEVLYHSIRGPEGWGVPAQFSPQIASRGEVSGGTSRTSKTNALSADLSCGLVTSNQLLTTDPGTRLVVEAGGANLYRRNSDGSYTAITKLPPEKPEAELPGSSSIDLYSVYGYSEDCGKVVFESPFRYPGVPAVNVNPVGQEFFLYEWEEGALRNVGVVPTGSGETEVAATVGELRFGRPQIGATNGVSADGSRVFFAAERRSSANPGEIGKVGIFVREDGRTTRDLSKSETGVADRGATFQYATPDGSRVFFIANAGLTPVSSTEGLDLYEYDLESNRLTDLSVSADAGGAEVGTLATGGFLGASRDGAQVYFAARGELVPGRGRSFAQNVAAKTFSIYGERNGIVSYAGTMAEADLAEQKDSVRVSPEGRYLLYQTATNVTGYNSGGAKEVYLFDAQSTAEPIVCVSCRPDGQPSLEPLRNDPLTGSVDRSNPFHPRAALVVRNGRAMAFFTSFDHLAPGAPSGQANLYEWTHNQVFLITSEPPGLLNSPEAGANVRQSIVFMGADADGSDLYLNTPAALTWENSEGRIAVYDARVDGGFPQPPAPPGPCASNVEGACQGPSASPPTVGNPSTPTFVGPGNKKPACKKGFVRKKGKCVKKQGGKKHKGSGKQKHGSKGKRSKGHGTKNQKGQKAARHANAEQGVGK